MARKNAAINHKSKSGKIKRTGTESSTGSQFPIVGVGASAGGLEAFTQLFKNLPANPGMAFVLIQHLAPAHESMLTELLSKTTAMPVKEVKDGMTVEPNNVYVIPPDTEMVIFQGVLHLTPREEGRRPHMPIDSFLRSLAQDRRNNAVAVIMSGSGSDGSNGIRAVKGEGGIVFAQDETAKYDGMPKSALDTGSVDFVLPPDKIAAELLRIRLHPYLVIARPGEAVQIMPAEENDLNKIFIMLRSAKGVDFTSYKRSTIIRRITRRMLLQKIEGMKEYVPYLKKNLSEIETLYQDILINVTSFFRDPEAFAALKRIVFPHIVTKAAGDVPVRIWIPACSTGEEAYSVAIALMEYMDDNNISRPVHLFATDIDDIAVEKARRGIYPENISRDVSPERLRRFFEKTGNSYVVNKFVRDMCIFAKQNMVKDPPFSKIDLISCRNLLIYFGQELQKRAISTVSYALNPKGFLMIGPSETVGEFADLFSVVDKKHAIYAKKAEQSKFRVEQSSKELAGSPRPLFAGVGLKPAAAPSDIQKEADAIILGKYSPAGFVVNDAMKIIQFRGDTGPYLRPTPGQASLNLLKMVSEYLVAELRTALHQAKKEGAPVRKERVRTKHDKRVKYINIDVVPFKAHESGERCFLVLLEEAGKSPIAEAKLIPARSVKGRAAHEEGVRLRQELAAYKMHLETVTQEYEAANEELRALNEELQSSNEEMQSINEEMETAKEELQSTNEELTTVNDELQSRNEETMQLNNDLSNVLRGVEIPIVLLGSELQIRRFNDAAARLLNLIPTDAGRPLSDIRTNIDIPDLESMVIDSINTLAVREKEVQDAGGRWYSLTIRPYKTVDNRIDGVLMTLADINYIKRSLLRVEGAYDYANAIVETVREPLLVLAPDLRVMTANKSFYENFLVVPEETENRFIYDLADGRWNISALRNLLEKILPENKVFSDLEIELELPNIGRRVMVLNARKIYLEEPYFRTTLNMQGHFDRLILLAIEDITERKQTEETLRTSSERYRSYIEVTGALGWTTNAEGEVVEDIPSWRAYTGQTYEEVKGQGWSKALHPDDLQHALQIWEKAVMGKSRYEVEYRIRRHDGIYRHFIVRGMSVLTEDGSVREWVGTCIDITERKKSEEALKMLNQELHSTADELKAANKDMESFSYAASHDLRSPLRSMAGFSAMLLRDHASKLDDTGKDLLKRISDNAIRMTRLIEDLLAFSRISTKEVRRSEFNMEALAHKLVDELKPMVGGRDIHFEIRQLPSAYGDLAMINQVLANLLSNAIKFTALRDSPVIEVGCASENDENIYYVRDNGMGFDMQFSDKLFGLFQRMHSSREVEGTGIGLVIVKNIIEKHGGRVWAEGQPEAGATFYFTLPNKTG